MTKKEITNWILNKIKYCYPTKHEKYPDNIIYMYDEKYIRKLKLGKINNQKINLPDKPKGICMFTQNLKYNIIYFNSDIIAKVFNDNNIVNYDYIQLIMTDVLCKCDFPKLNDNVKRKYIFERFQKITYNSR